MKDSWKELMREKWDFGFSKRSKKSNREVIKNLAVFLEKKTVKRTKQDFLLRKIETMLEHKIGFSMFFSVLLLILTIFEQKSEQLLLSLSSSKECWMLWMSWMSFNVLRSTTITTTATSIHFLCYKHRKKVGKTNRNHLKSHQFNAIGEHFGFVNKAICVCLWI